MNKDLLDKVKAIISDLFKEKYDQRSAYHSYNHTLEVVEAAEKIGKASDLNDNELEVVLLAAWFHDTGYLFNKINHEEHSANFAEETLQKLGYPENKILQVKNNIMATRMNQVPSNMMEEVLHDADYINLASPDNLKQSQLLRDEMVNYGGSKPTEEEWLMAELKFLLNHRYYTPYSRNKLEDKKNENIKKIKKKLKEFRKTEALTENKPVTAVPDEKKEIPLNYTLNGKTMDNTKEDKDKEDDSKDIIESITGKKEDRKEEKKEDRKEEKRDDKSDDKKDDKKEDKKETKKAAEKQEAVSIKEFDAMYKLVVTNHMRMNAIADRKANIMLTLNGIIISLTLSVVASSSENNLRFIIPTSIIILVCLFTIIFAALATRPKITSGKVEKEDIQDKKANLLFFGNFSRMEFEDFDWGIRQIITDQEYLHNSMIIDFYSLGKVLDQKYKYLRICYNVFMWGIVAAVLSIAILIATGY